MATHTTGIGDVVVVIDVAVRTGSRRNGMRSGQRPAGCRVIENAVHPIARVVALLARRREVCTDVIDRRFRVVVIVLMTAYATGIGDVVVVIDMTICALAWGHGVHASQGEAGLGVVEACRRPSAGGVAHLAGLREVLLHVIGIGRALVVLEVARNARRVGDVVVVIDVAIAALARRHRV